jgi:hypothetical protein
MMLSLQDLKFGSRARCPDGYKALTANGIDGAVVIVSMYEP